MQKKILLFTIFISYLIGIKAQDLSSQGTDFWCGYGYHANMMTSATAPKATGGDQSMILYFANTSTTLPAHVTVELPLRYNPGRPISANNPWKRSYTIAPGGSLISDTIPKSYGTRPVDNLFSAILWNTGLHNKGIHITSDVPIAAYEHIYYSAASGASLLYPTNVLGTEYYAVSFTQTSNVTYGNNMLFIVATEDSTTVEITPTAPTTVDATTKKSHPAGVTFTVKLNKGQIYNVLGKNDGSSTTGDDLTGTYIKSVSTGTAGGGCKRIAVFSGAGRIQISSDNCPGQGFSSDNLIQQCLPVSAWGKTYYTTTTLGTSDGNAYRICVSDPTANVTIDGVPIDPSVTPLINNFYYQFESDQNSIIQSDKPILVSQYCFSTSGCKSATDGDPEMFFLSPAEQNIKKVTFYSSANYSINHSYVNIAIDTGGAHSFLLDGQDPVANGLFYNASDWQPFPYDPSHVYGTFEVSLNSAHQVEADSGFNGIAYGLGSVESWGYNMGSNVRDLTVQTPRGNDTTGSVLYDNFACPGTPNYFYLDIPYDSTQISGMVWDFASNPNVSPNLVTETAPLSPTKSYSFNGKTLYSYRIKYPVSFSQVGVYPVKVVVTVLSTSGCFGPKEYNFVKTVSGAGHANFNIIYNGCKSDTVKFINTSDTIGSSIPFVGWLWNFGDFSKTDTATNPIHVYPNKDKYNINLTAINAIGCSVDTTVTFDLAAGLTPKFGVSADTICLGTTITLTDSSTQSGQSGNISKWIWNYGDGTPTDTLTVGTPVTHTYTKPGLYKVAHQFITVLGCSSKIDTIAVLVAALPVANFKLPHLCVPGYASFTNLTDTAVSGPSTYFWDFGDNDPTNNTLKDPAHLYTTAPGSAGYNISLTATSIFGCKSNTVTKVADSLLPKPTAAFNVGSKSCLNDTTRFFDASSGFNQTITTWSWLLGDNSIDNTKDPKHIYATYGNYTIKLVVTSNEGCISDTTTKSIYVNPLPRAGFIIPNGCINSNQISFTDTSFILPDNGTQKPFTYFWTFGDANNNATSTAPNGVHIFPAAGTYLITQAVTSANGCKGVDTASFVLVGTKPKPKFVIKNAICSNEQLTLTDTSRIDIGVINKVEIIWDTLNPTTTLVVDNNPSNGAFGSSKPYYYNYPPLTITKTYTIKLRAYSGSDCFDSIIQDITVYSIPHVTFNTLPGICANASPRVFTQASETTGVAGNFSYAGPGASGNTFNPVNTAGPNTYIVSAIFTTPGGCADTANQNITVWPLPSAQFSITPFACEQHLIYIKDSSVANYSNIITWDWDLGDSKPSYTNNTPFTHLYATADTFPVSLTVTTDSGCVAKSIVKPVIIYPKLIANFTVKAQNCLKDTILFTNTSTALSQKITNWVWVYGDGKIDTASSSTVKHYYDSTGTYTVKLLINSDKGCISDTSATQSVKINPLPTASFIIPGSCITSGAVVFVDSSYIVNDGTQLPFTYNWNFGDIYNASPTNPNNSTAQNGQHVYSTPGTYTIIEKVTSNNGCIAFDTLLFDIAGSRPKPAFVVNNSNGLCSNVFVSITDTSRIDVGVIKKIEITWDTAAPTIIKTDNRPSNGSIGSSKDYIHKYPVLGVDKTYTIKLRAYSGNACYDETFQTITVHATPQVRFRQIAGICLNATPRLLVEASEANNIPGTFIYSGPGVTNNTFDPIAAGGVGTDSIKVNYTSLYGCQDSAYQNISVWPLPTTAIGIGKVRCETRGTLFFDTSLTNFATIVQWSWNMGDGKPLVTQTSANPFLYTFDTAGLYHTSLIVTTDSGCSSIAATKDVLVYPVPQVKFVIPTNICLPFGVGYFQDSSYIKGYNDSLMTYLWKFGDTTNIDTSILKNPTHQFGQPLQATYIISHTVMANRCDSTLTQTLNAQLNIHPQPKASFTMVPANGEVCIGQPIQFIDNTNANGFNVVKSIWYLGDGTIDTSLNFTHIYASDVNYRPTHAIIDANGCVSDTVGARAVVYHYPIVNAGPDKYVIAGDTTMLTPTVSNLYAGYDPKVYWTCDVSPSYLLNDSVFNPIAIPYFTQDTSFYYTYTFHVIGQGQCMDSGVTHIRTLNKPRIPTAFSPNNDGVHDKWEIPFLSNYPNVGVKIFNRYGQLIFESTGAYTSGNAWDGSYHGTPLPVGTYYYFIKVHTPGMPDFSGAVTIFK